MPSERNPPARGTFALNTKPPHPSPGGAGRIWGMDGDWVSEKRANRVYLVLAAVIVVWLAGVSLGWWLVLLLVGFAGAIGYTLWRNRQ